MGFKKTEQTAFIQNYNAAEFCRARDVAEVLSRHDFSCPTKPTFLPGFRQPPKSIGVGRDHFAALDGMQGIPGGSVHRILHKPHRPVGKCNIHAARVAAAGTGKLVAVRITRLAGHKSLVHTEKPGRIRHLVKAILQAKEILRTIRCKPAGISTPTHHG